MAFILLRKILPLFAIALTLFSLFKLLDTTNVFAADEWQLDGWTHRKKITIDNSDRSETLNSFVTLVQLNASNFDFSQAKADGADIRFVTSSNQTIDYEIETWNAESEIAEIWVNLPSIQGNSAADYFYLYFGNTAADNAENKTAVWDSNFRMVQHLHDQAATPSAVSLGTRPWVVAGDEANLYIGSQQSGGLRILSKADFSPITTLSSGLNVERAYVRGRYLAYTASDLNNIVYDLQTNTVVTTVTTDNNARAVFIDSNNRVYFGESNSGVIHYVDIPSLTSGSFTPATSDIRDIGENADELLIASNDDNVYLVNRSTLTTTHVFSDGNPFNIEVAQMDNDFIWFAGDMKQVKIKERNSPYADVATLYGPNSDITHVDHDDDYWFVSSDDGKLYIYDETYNLISALHSGGDAFVEYFWLDKTNNILYFVRGGSGSGNQQSNLFYYSYASDPGRYGKKTDSTTFGTTLKGTQSTSEVIGKIGQGISFEGTSSSYLEQQLYFSAWNNQKVSTASGQTFMYSPGANYAPFAGDGITNNYFLRYYTSTVTEGGYVGSLGSGLNLTQKVVNGDFEGSFSGGLASGWSKSSSATGTQEGTIVHGGSKAQKLTANNTTSVVGISQTPTLPLGKLYKYSAWVYSQAGGNVTFLIGNKFNNFTVPAATWTELTGYNTVLSGANDNFFRVYHTPGVLAIGQYIIFDDISVQEVTEIPANEGATIYSGRTNNTEALALFGQLDKNAIGNNSIFASSTQITGPVTLEAWVKPTTDVGIKNIAGNWINNKGYLLYRSDKKFLAKINEHTIDLGATDKDAEQWYYLALVVDGANEKIYVNGELYVSESNGAALPPLADRLVIGAGGITFTDPYTGSIDEIRLAATDRSSDWISAQYDSMSNSFLAFSDTETIPSPTSSTPAPTSSPTETNGSNTAPVTNNNQQTTACSSTPATNSPDLFRIDTNDTEAKLYYAPVTGNSTDYEIFYSENPAQDQHSVATGQGNSTGVLTYVVRNLKPKTTYYFKVRAKNDCAPSGWSEIMSISTRNKNAQSFLTNHKHTQTVSKIKQRTISTINPNLPSSPTISSTQQTTIEAVSPAKTTTEPASKENEKNKICIFKWCFRVF